MARLEWRSARNKTSRPVSTWAGARSARAARPPPKDSQPRHLSPRWLLRRGYRDLLALLQANCRNAGALRIDHAFSLARLYWIPRGGDPRAGTYVGYPLDDLRGIVALASVRERCVVIGEDLGTVPEGFRERMEETGILSYRILFFERRDDGTFIPPEQYPHAALAASGTHDLPTLPAWLRGEDVDLRDRLGLPRDARRAGAHRARTRPQHAARRVDRARDLDPAQRSDDAAVVIAANRYLAATPCAIVMAQLDDVLGERAPVNVPGTSTQYPNWRRKLGTSPSKRCRPTSVSESSATLCEELRPKQRRESSLDGRG